MARFAFVTGLLVLATIAVCNAQAPAGKAAANPCKGPGWYHLSCYKATVTPAAAKAAKEECLTAYSKTNGACFPVVKDAGSNFGGCETYITYAFTDKACLNQYQATEKSNPACKLYTSSGLGDAANRASYTGKADYECPA